MISTHLYFYKHILSEMGIYLSKERGKPTYSLNYLKKMKQKKSIWKCNYTKTNWSNDD